MKLITNLKTAIKLWRHKHLHQGNVVNFMLRITPYYRLYKCSFCAKQVEIRL